jgi:hypothetical protein
VRKRQPKRLAARSVLVLEEYGEVAFSEISKDNGVGLAGDGPDDGIRTLRCAYRKLASSSTPAHLAVSRATMRFGFPRLILPDGVVFIDPLGWFVAFLSKLAQAISAFWTAVTRLAAPKSDRSASPPKRDSLRELKKA